MLAVLRDSDDYLPQSRSDVQNYVDTCPDCRVRLLKKNSHLVKNPICASHPLEHVQVDCVELTIDDLGMKYLSNQLDLFSKFAHSIRTALYLTYFPPFSEHASFQRLIRRKRRRSLWYQRMQVKKMVPTSDIDLPKFSPTMEASISIGIILRFAKKYKLRFFTHFHTALGCKARYETIFSDVFFLIKSLFKDREVQCHLSKYARRVIEACKMV